MIAQVALRRLLGVAGAAFLVVANGVSAQATRTWVSGVGDDVNPCSRVAPCKTFAGAITKTATNGEISVLDPGGFGAVTITKGITIDGGGIQGGITAAGANAIIVNVPATDVVILRNLNLVGITNGSNGIRFLAGGALHVENVSVSNFAGSGSPTGNGIDFNPTNAAALYVTNSTFRNNGLTGIFVRPQGLGSATVHLTNVRLEDNGGGYYQTDNVLAVVRDSVVTGNTGNGMQVNAPLASSKLQLDRVTVSLNGGIGVRTDGAQAVIRLSGSTVVQNHTGLSLGGGTILSFGNNAIAGNTPGGDGSPSTTTTLR